MSMNELKAYEFFNEPIELSFDDYSEVKQRAVQHLMSFPEIRSVYSLGAEGELPRCPGISDIDLIFAVDDLRQTSPESFMRLWDNSVKTRYILCHGLGYAANRDLLENIHLVFSNPCLNFRWEAGERIDFSKPSNLEKKSAYLISKVALMPSRSLRYYECFVKKEVDVRAALKMLYGHRYDMAILKELGYARGHWDVFSQEVDEFYGGWFSLAEDERKRRLIGLLKAGQSVYREMIEGLGHFISREGHLITNGSEGEEILMELGCHCFLLFSDRLWKQGNGLYWRQSNSWFEDRLPGNIRKAIASTRWNVFVLPLAIAPVFYAHARFDTLFGQQIRSKMEPSINKTSLSVGPICHPLVKQAKIFDEHWRFLGRNHLRNSACAFVEIFRQNRFRERFFIQAIKGSIKNRLSDFRKSRTSRWVQACLYPNATGLRN